MNPYKKEQKACISRLRRLQACNKLDATQKQAVAAAIRELQKARRHAGAMNRQEILKTITNVARMLCDAFLENLENEHKVTFWTRGC